MAIYRDRAKPNPPGYELMDVVVCREQRLAELELFLPATTTTKTMVREMKDQAAQAQLTRQIEVAKSDEVSMVTPGEKKRTSNNFEEFDPASEREELYTRAQEDEISLCETHRQVYEWDAPLLLLENKRTPSEDVLSRNREIFKKLKELGHMRRIARPESDRVFDALMILRDRQPHFCAVIDLVRQHLRLAFAQGKPLHLPPILLLGEPGVGKTHFTQHLAAALQTPMRRHGFDSSTTGSAITGSDKHWGNTSYGLMFELLCLQDIINPVVLLDELDKASDYPQRHPAAPLHTLLEPVSASHATDLSVGLSFDASCVTWVAAGNDPSRIPASLRSRFIEFLILPPLGQQALEVASNIAESVFLDLKLPDIERVPPGITKLLAHLTAREQMQFLKRAFASAFDDKRTCIALHDFPKEIFDEDTENKAICSEKLYH